MRIGQGRPQRDQFGPARPGTRDVALPEQRISQLQQRARVGRLLLVGALEQTGRLVGTILPHA